MNFSHNFYKSDNFILKYFSRIFISKLSKINKSKNTSQFVLLKNDHVSNEILIDGYYEGKELKILCEWLKKKKRLKLAIDIGAYIGNHSIFFSNYFKNVISFEPNSLSYKLLSINTEKRKNIKIFNLGLSNINSTKDFYSYEDNYGGSSIKKNSNLKFDKIKAKFLKFDNLKINQKADLIKIDVEGEELNVLKGMNIYLKKFKPTIIFECQEKEIFKGSTKVINFLKKKNYKNFYSIENFDKVNVNLIDRLLYFFKYIFFSRKKYIVRKDNFEKKFYNFIIAEYN